MWNVKCFIFNKLINLIYKMFTLKASYELPLDHPRKTATGCDYYLLHTVAHTYSYYNIVIYIVLSFMYLWENNNEITVNKIGIYIFFVNNK